jgi:hypothetical protein
MMYVLVFVAMTALDFCYGEYTKAAADRRLYPAASWAMVLYLLGGFVAISYIDNHWMMVPAAFGAFSGTYLSIRFGK